MNKQEELKKNVMEKIMLVVAMGVEFDEEKCSDMEIYFSVPSEFSLNSNVKEKMNNESAQKIKDLICEIAAIASIADEDVFDDYKEDVDDFISHIHQEIKEQVKFYMKERDEIWTKEKGNEAIKRYTEEIKESLRYKKI